MDAVDAVAVRDLDNKASSWEVYMVLDPANKTTPVVNKTGNLRMRFLPGTNTPVLEVRHDLLQISDIVSFSLQEETVAGLMIKGHSNNEIADTMGLAKTTVHTFIRRMCEKTGARNSRALIMFLVKRQLQKDARER